MSLVSALSPGKTSFPSWQEMQSPAFGGPGSFRAVVSFQSEVLQEIKKSRRNKLIRRRIKQLHIVSSFV